MAISVEIDKQSGFCGGVIRAISLAEKYLSDNPGKRLYSIGAIVHNDAELKRLESEGLVTIVSLSERLPKGATVLIRAHGEPKETYELASRKGYSVIDCTCPVVLRLQKRIRDTYSRLHSNGSDGQIIIFGKIGHAEVIGLVSQVGGDAVVIENKEMLLDAIRSGRIDVKEPVEVFSQTTKSPDEYREICGILRCAIPEGLLTVHNTICSQVASRYSQLSAFAVSHDVIVFVSGKDSSNGRVLFNLCKSFNPKTHSIDSADALDPLWFGPDDKVGICGATSTPKWLLSKVAKVVLDLNQQASSYGPSCQ